MCENEQQKESRKTERIFFKESILKNYNVLHSELNESKMYSRK
jgi:hypothetical protein